MNLAQRIGQECKALWTAIATKINLSEKGAPDGVCPLNGSALIDAVYLPSFVDDVLEVATYADLPVSGESGKIYIVVADETSGGDTSSYRWTGTVYAMVSNTLTAADIKSLYESNPDTNAFTDAYKLELDLIDQGLATTDSPTFVGVSVDSLVLKGGTGTQGTVSWNGDEETLDLIQNGAVLQLGQEVQWHCRNNTVSTISQGTPVMATGTVGASGRITIAPMDGTVKSNSTFFLGIATEDILAGEDGKITHFGKVRGIDTTGTPYSETWNDGDVIYISGDTIGDLTNIEPAADKMKLPVAYVILSHGSTGSLAVRVGHHDAHILANELTYDNTTSGMTATVVQDAIDELDGRLDPVETKLAGIEDGATADQTGAEIKALYELEPSAFTDAQFTKLAGIEDGATADQVWGEITGTLSNQTDLQNALDAKENIANKGVANGYASLDGSGLIPASQLPSYVDDVIEVATYADLPGTGTSGFIYIVVADETSGGNTSTYRWTGTIYALVSDTMSASDIKSLYESNADTNAFTDALLSKLNGIETAATADQTGAEIKSLYEAELDTNAFTDAEKSKLAAIEAGATADQVWGEIGGTLSNQTDLQSALNGKASLNSNVSFNTITPQTDATYDFGSSSLYFRDGYVKNLLPFDNGVDENILIIKGTRFTNLQIETDKSNLAQSDPVITLRDSAAGVEWDIRQDTSEGGIIDFRYNNSSRTTIDTTGLLDTTGGLATDGFTRMGTNAPVIKTKKITGTTAAAEGSSVNAAHGLTGDKIISFTLKVYHATNQGVPHAYIGTAGYEASIYHNSTDFVVKNITANSSNILSKPFTIYITYEE